MICYIIYNPNTHHCCFNSNHDMLDFSSHSPSPQTYSRDPRNIWAHKQMCVRSSSVFQGATGMRKMHTYICYSIFHIVCQSPCFKILP